VQTRSQTLQFLAPSLWRRIAGAVHEVVQGDGDRAQTLRHAVAAFLIRVASAGILYASQIVLARWMGTFEYGIYVFVWTWVLVLGGISSAGLSFAMIRLVPQLRETEDTAQLRGLLFGGRLFSVGLSTFIAGAAGTLLWLFPQALAQHYVLPVFLALVCLPLYTLTDVQDGIGRGQAWMGVALLPPYVFRPILLLAAMTCAVGLGLPATAVTAAAAAIFATWLSAIMQTIALHLRLRKFLPQGPRTYAPGAWAGTALPLLVIGACEMLMQNVDVLVISMHMTPADAGIYYAAAKTMSLIMFVHYAVGSAVASRFAALHARGDHDELRRFVRDAVNWTFWPSLAAAVAVLLLGRPLLSLFGPQFLTGYPVMLILVVGFLSRSAMGPSEFLLNMLGEQRACAHSLLVAALICVCLNLLLVPLWGLIGAATSTAAALASVAALNYFAVRRRLNLDVAIWANLKWREPRDADQTQ